MLHMHQFNANYKKADVEIDVINFHLTVNIYNKYSYPAFEK